MHLMHPFVDFDQVHPVLYLLLCTVGAIIVASILLASIVRFGLTRPEYREAHPELFTPAPIVPRAEDVAVLEETPTQPINIPEIRE